MSDHKAEWEIELEKLTQPMPPEAKADGTFPTEKLLEVLGDIERAATRAKSYLATGMPAEMRVELNKLRALLKVLEKDLSMSVDTIVSLLKAGVSEKVLKEVYGATGEEIEKARKLLEAEKSSSPQPEEGGESEPGVEQKKGSNPFVIRDYEKAGVKRIPL
jgi:hypothetical protein